MSSAKPRAVAEINLEEFERRLRAAVAPQAGIEDPLAELTRLVDTIGFDRSPSERALEADRALRAKPKPELRLAPAPAPQAPEPVIEPPAPEPPVVAEAEPPLRPSFDGEESDPLAFEPPPVAPVERDEPVLPKIAPAAPPPRARNWGIKIGGLVAAAAVMAGAVVVFSVGVRKHQGPPPLILASTAPTKVPPPSEATVRTANESGSLLTRDTAQPTPTSPKLVDQPEAPVDLSARQQPAASTDPSPTASLPTPAHTANADAAVVSATAAPAASAKAEVDASPVAPSSDTPIVASAPKENPISPVGDDPNRVKTISVRPDGTLISSGYEPAASATPPAAAPPAPEQTQASAEADGEPASPAVALPTKLSPGKNSARVVSKTSTTAPADAGSGPAPAAPKAKKSKPADEVAANTNTDDADAPAAASGGYAVQLAAPKSENEAKALIKRFTSRYASALGGNALGVRKADRHGEPIFRIRAGGLSKADAAAMCAKIKSAGGDCYVAKN